jgi:hypothetical protein
LSDIRSKPSTPAYREAWSRIFGATLIIGVNETECYNTKIEIGKIEHFAEVESKIDWHKFLIDAHLINKNEERDESH